MSTNPEMTSAGNGGTADFTLKRIDEMDALHHGAVKLAAASVMSSASVVHGLRATAEPTVVDVKGEELWFLGTFVRMKLDSEQTAGRFGLFEVLLPRGASPPLHSHPQDETFYVLEGEVTAWLVEPELASSAREHPSTWVETCGRRCGVGAVVFAPGGTAHTFRVETDTARMLVISTPGGIENMVRGLSEPAKWPWLQPPPDGPRAPAERIALVERETGMVRHGPPPPADA
jgi:quercetin dioxygenase-like cupin family protein